MSSPSVHQVLMGASTRDAITNMAFLMQQALRDESIDSRIFSFYGGDHTIAGEVLHLDELGSGSSDDVLIYHSSFGHPDLTARLAKRKEKLVLVYHNITPSKYYESIDSEFAAGLKWGREELLILKDRVVLAFADSVFNAEDLSSYGYSNITVIPAGLNPGRINKSSVDIGLLGELSQHFPSGFILFVSQVLPHKRVEMALQVIHLLRAVHDLDVGLVVAGPARRPGYLKDLMRYRDRLGEAHVLFAGEVSDDQLATLYRSCSAFVGTSDHEGLSIPPLEAMASGAPVVVRACGAVPETVGDAALVIPASAGVCEFTEAVALVLEDKSLAARLRAMGYSRIKEIEATNPTTSFIQTLKENVL